MYIIKYIFRCHIFKALHWILSKEPEVEALPVPVVEDLLMCQEYLQAEEPLTWLRQQLIVSPEKVIQTAFQTTGQRENAVWAAIRKLRFTASNFGNIIAAAKRNRYIHSYLRNKVILHIYRGGRHG